MSIVFRTLFRIFLRAAMDFYRLETLRKEKGITNTFLCTLVGQRRQYITDSKNKNIKIPMEYVKKWADALDTTPEYLNGETDIKEKPTTSNEDRLTEEQKELIELYRLADPEIQRVALTILKAAKAADKARDD